MKHTFLSAFAFFSVLGATQAVALTYTAQYAAIPQEQAPDQIPYGLTGKTLSVPKFLDPKCQLTEVEITIEGEVLYRTSVDAGPGSPANVTVSRGGAFLNFTGPSAATTKNFSDNNFNLTFSLGADEGEFFPDFAGVDSATDLTRKTFSPIVFSVTGAELANFMGPGDVDFVLNGGAANSDTGTVAVDGLYQTYGGGKISVRYVVKCPDSSSVLSLGLFCGLTILGYRRFSA